MNAPKSQTTTFKRTPCQRCGAKTEKQADSMCKPQVSNGEYDCTGMYMDTKNGWLGIDKDPRRLQNV